MLKTRTETLLALIVGAVALLILAIAEIVIGFWCSGICSKPRDFAGDKLV